MLRVVDLRWHTGDPRPLMPRASADREAARATVREIVSGVRERGDEAALWYQSEHGAPPAALRVPADEIEAARGSCPPGLLRAIGSAAERVRRYHEEQLERERARSWRNGERDMRVGEVTRAVRRAGCYVPGGRAAYPSSVLMTAIPARVAGVIEVVVCCPPGPDGHINAATLAACAVADVDEVYALGGAQAIALMAYGSQTLRPVDVICGPGNQWVTLAKHEVAMDVGVDSFAGPTEVAVVADGTASARHVAADLIAQAEHDPAATALLITTSEGLVREVIAELEREVPLATRREDIETSLRDNGRVLIARDLDHALSLADLFAPEHLELMVEGAEERAEEAGNAGAVFVGPYSPVAIGDYIAGTNHVLPTAGSARFSSPLRVSTFMRSTAVVSFTRDGLDRVSADLYEIARAEGLDAHARAVQVRLEGS